MKFKTGVFLLAALFFGTAGMQAQASEVTERFSDVYEAQEQIPEPEKEFTDSHGNRYVLERSEVEKFPVTGRKKEVKGEILYESVEAGEVIPDKGNIEIRDEESGQAFTRTLPLIRTDFSDERWLGDFSFTVTFHSYDAEVFFLGEVRIPAGGEKPLLAGSEAELLNLIGLDKENFQIEDYRWEGEAYWDEEGELCRDAKAFGKRKVSDCLALYGGTVSLPDLAEYRGKYIYIRTAEETAFETALSTEEESGGTALKTEEGLWERFCSFIRKHIRVILWLPGILIVLLILRILFYLIKRMKKEKRGRR